MAPGFSKTLSTHVIRYATHVRITALIFRITLSPILQIICYVQVSEYYNVVSGNNTSLHTKISVGIPGLLSYFTKFSFTSACCKRSVQKLSQFLLWSTMRNCSKHFAKRWYKPEFSVNIVKHVPMDCQSE